RDEMAAVQTRDFRLTKQVRPRRYEISLDLDLENWTASGRERIELQSDAPFRELTLHSQELDIKTARIDAAIEMTRVTYQQESETATLEFGSEVAAGQHILEIEWTGQIREALRGL